MLAYLQGAHDAIGARMEPALAIEDPKERLRAIGDDIAAQIRSAGFRGCAFIKVADWVPRPAGSRPARPSRRTASGFRRSCAPSFADAERPIPANPARHFVTCCATARWLPPTSTGPGRRPTRSFGASTGSCAWAPARTLESRGKVRRHRGHPRDGHDLAGGLVSERPKPVADSAQRSVVAQRQRGGHERRRARRALDRAARRAPSPGRHPHQPWPRDRRRRRRRREPRRAATRPRRPDPDLRRRRLRVLDDVGQRLGDDEVRARLDLAPRTARLEVDLDGQRRDRSATSDAGAEPAAGEDGGQDPVGELAQLVVAPLGLLERLGDERTPPRAVLVQGLLGELERHDRVDEPLLGAVVEVAHDPPAGLVAGGEQARARGGELVAAVGVRDRGLEQLRELAMRSSVSAGGVLLARPVRDVMPQSRPSTMIGAPTLARTPSSWSTPASRSPAGRGSSIRAGRPVRRDLAVTFSPSCGKR